MRRYTVDVVFKTRRRNREGQRNERKVIIVDMSLGVMCQYVFVYARLPRVVVEEKETPGSD